MLIAKLFLTELRRDLKLWWSYRLDAISSILLWVVAFPLIILMFDSVADGYETERRVASLVGFLVWNLCMGLLDSTTAAISDEVQVGTLEAVMISPLSPATLFALRIAAAFARQAVETILLGIVLVFVLRLPITLNLPALLVMFLTILAVGGVGLALGGLALIYKNVASLVSVVTLLALFFTGAIIPLNDLGAVFDVLKYILPTTWGIDALRQALVDSQAWPHLLKNGAFLGLSIQAAIFIGVGILMFNRGFQRAQNQGSLGTY